MPGDPEDHPPRGWFPSTAPATIGGWVSVTKAEEGEGLEDDVYPSDSVAFDYYDDLVMPVGAWADTTGPGDKWQRSLYGDDYIGGGWYDAEACHHSRRDTPDAGWPTAQWPTSCGGTSSNKEFGSTQSATLEARERRPARYVSGSTSIQEPAIQSRSSDLAPMNPGPQDNDLKPRPSDVDTSHRAIGHPKHHELDRLPAQLAALKLNTRNLPSSSTWKDINTSKYATASGSGKQPLSYIGSVKGDPTGSDRLAATPTRIDGVVDQLMASLQRWLDASLQARGATGKGASSHQPTSGTGTSSASQHGSENHRVNKRSRDCSDDDTGQDDDGTQDRSEPKRGRLALGPQVRQDLKSAPLLIEHQRADIICQRQDQELEHGIDEEQERALRSRKKNNGKSKMMVEEEKWVEAYKVIFPQDDPVPSPYFVCCPIHFGPDVQLMRDNILANLDEFEEFVRGEFLRRMRPEAESLVDGAVAERLTSMAHAHFIDIMRSFLRIHGQSVGQADTEGSSSSWTLTAQEASTSEASRPGSNGSKLDEMDPVLDFLRNDGLLNVESCFTEAEAGFRSQPPDFLTGDYHPVNGWGSFGSEQFSSI
ncbi:hypothetical protein ACJZ2D_012289 [Fusarium nematophilum]